MKLSLVLASYLKQSGFRNVHCVTGGAVVHLIDSFHQVGLKCIFYQHEQSAGFGAVAESKLSNKPSICLVTTGPGGTNAITPLLSAWQDSLPVLFLSGQSRLEHSSRYTGVRQLGTQEFDIASFVRPITKSSIMLEDTSKLLNHLSQSLYRAVSDRPGPVWFDIPLDFQWSNLPVSETFTDALPSVPSPTPYSLPTHQASAITSYLNEFSKSPRPAILIGGGVRDETKQSLVSHLESHSVPYLVTYTSISCTQSLQHKFNFGVPGIAGNRAANSIISNCSHLLCIGTHLPVPITGANHRLWSTYSSKCLVNIDPLETSQHRLSFDNIFTCPAEHFVSCLCKSTFNISPLWSDYLSDLRLFREPRVESAKPYLDLYEFVSAFSSISSSNTIITIDGGGTINSAFFSCFSPLQKTKIVMSSAVCAMGSGLPELIGSWASDSENSRIHNRYILLVGDGSLAFNIQELSTIMANSIPAHIFVVCNEGYSSIRNTLNQFLDKRHHGVSPSSGVPLPSIQNLANTYGFSYHSLSHESKPNLGNIIHTIINKALPSVNQVLVDPLQIISPVQGFRENSEGSFSASPLYQMDPQLSPDLEQLFSRFITTTHHE
jgi:acetolactate synthase-1/2/3 large subunit